LPFHGIVAGIILRWHSGQVAGH